MPANLMLATSALPQVFFSGQLPAVEAALYTCPLNSSAKIANGSVANVSGAAVTFGLSLVKAGGALDGTHLVIPGSFSIDPGDTLPLKDLLGGHQLGPGDFVAGVCSSAAACTLVLSGTVYT